MLNKHKTIRDNIERFNKPLPLVEYLVPLVEDKKDIKIVDIGSGPFGKIGQYLDGVKVEIYHCDKQDFTEFWKKHNAASVVSVEYQDMEKLTYPDDFFDIIYCSNALDHTKNALAAVKEMIRVCKSGGWVYIECWLDQLSTRGKHYWNTKEDGVFINKTGRFDLKDFGFKIEFIDNHGLRRYNRIIATLQK